MKRFLKACVRAIFFPFTIYLDRRIAGVHEHLDQLRTTGATELEIRLRQLVDEVVALRTEVIAQAELNAELSATLTRFAEDVASRLENVGLVLDAEVVSDLRNQSRAQSVL